MAYSNVDRYSDALNSYQQALPLLRQVQAQQGKARTLNKIATLCMKQQSYDAALSHYHCCAR